MLKPRSMGLYMAAVAISLSGCANSAFVAYEKTAIFGESREVVQEGLGYAYRFPYRNGVVTYEPERGSYWDASSQQASSVPVGNAGQPGLFSNKLPHGCLVFACTRAEEVRYGRMPGASRSQAVAFQRTDGSGHAFVVYDVGGRTVAEDDRGYRVDVPGWNQRSSEEALKLARAFSVQTHPAGYAQPANAKFIGTF